MGSRPEEAPPLVSSMPGGNFWHGSTSTMATPRCAAHLCSPDRVDTQVQMSPACPGFGASASPGGRTLDSASRKVHHLLLHAMQDNPCSPGWDPHLQPPVASGSCVASPLPSPTSARALVCWLDPPQPAMLPWPCPHLPQAWPPLPEHPCLPPPAWRMNASESRSSICVFRCSSCSTKHCGMYAPAQLVWRCSVHC